MALAYDTEWPMKDGRKNCECTSASQSLMFMYRKHQFAVI